MNGYHQSYFHDQDTEIKRDQVEFLELTASNCQDWDLTEQYRS